jgi:S1-C subfamily serine protease
MRLLLDQIVRENEMASVLTSFSQELATIAERAGQSVVTVFGRPRQPSSGIHWRKGVVVTAEHTIRREDEISVLLPDGKRVAAKLAGRDPGRDTAILKIDADLPAPAFADAANLKLANLVLALGRTRAGNLVASSGIIGGLSGEWRSWRGGRIDQAIRLDLALYPGFSGGPLLNVDGKVVGMNTKGLGRGRAVTLPSSTVNRSVDELLEKGHIARPYLGIAMQPVAVPEKLRSKMKSPSPAGLMVLHVEPGAPADRAGILLGDVIVELDGRPALDTDNLWDILATAHAGDKFDATVVRGGTLLSVSITLGERPAR